jgi:alginate O-acetyltransferase complex protein AlgI
VDYVTALILPQVTTTWKRRTLLIGSISTNLALLAFFKYTNFLIGSALTSLNVFGFKNDPFVLNIILPLGISFYTFETISYIVDVYQGKIKPVRNLLDYALYIMFFPHLVAGPIVRPRDFLPQLQQTKRWNWDRLQLGMQFFLVGLFKKAVIADQLATIADPIFAKPDAYATSSIWLGVLCYAVQIYCDFSGYSDMAVGLAHTLGFKLPKNFNLPYFAANITDFWRRWHISLSSWLRDYLYIPLGGSRHGELATYRNLMLTMLLGGLWHGASWTFVMWGLYHGILLSLHRAIKLPSWLGHAVFKPFFVAATFLAVCVGWVFFRAQTFAEAGLILQKMAWITPGKSIDPTAFTFGLAGLLFMLLCYLIATFVNVRRVERWVPAPVLGTAMAVVFLLSQVLMPEDGKAFIYFQF